MLLIPASFDSKSVQPLCLRTSSSSLMCRFRCCVINARKWYRFSVSTPAITCRLLTYDRRPFVKHEITKHDCQDGDKIVFTFTSSLGIVKFRIVFLLSFLRALWSWTDLGRFGNKRNKSYKNVRKTVFIFQRYVCTGWFTKTVHVKYLCYLEEWEKQVTTKAHGLQGQVT